jgi:hypothetical protein
MGDVDSYSDERWLSRAALLAGGLVVSAYPKEWANPYTWGFPTIKNSVYSSSRTIVAEKREQLKVGLRVLARMHSGRPDPREIDLLRSWVPEHLQDSAPDELALYIIHDAMKRS